MQNFLDEKQQAVIFIAAFAAKGDMPKLNKALNEGIETGMTINEVKEILVQLYAYVGFPRSLNALSELMSVMEQRDQQGLKNETGKEATPFPVDWDSLQSGTRNQTQLVGQSVKGPLFEFAPVVDQFLKSHLFGDIFQRDTLSWQTRELATISALAAISGVNSQLKSHYSISLQTGLTGQQLWAFIECLKLKFGDEVVVNAAAVLKEVLSLTHHNIPENPVAEKP
ncbi:carboxymuconolactone decarboxylase family protein [Pantoea sp. T14]|uniref:carboxymuconolactone decarboxylase family protein n=1 Tax=Pantoea sp. T14 TaxID=3085685 RepID=UPI002FC96BBE